MPNDSSLFLSTNSSTYNGPGPRDDADNYLNFFKPPQNWKKLAGFNIYHIKNENFPQIQNIDDCAQMTLQLNGKSFDYSAFGCYINAGDTSTYGSLLESSDRYSYYELLKPFN
eukprot:Awhi_evm2s12853